MTKKSNGRYSKEFRCEAVKLVTEGDLSVYEASRQLSLPKSTLENRVRAFKSGKLQEIGSQQRPLTDIERELAQVKRELSIVKQERDILDVTSRLIIFQGGVILYFAPGICSRASWTPVNLSP